jgi:hypothetical protein
MDELLAGMGRLGVQPPSRTSADDILGDLLSRMTIRDQAGNQLQSAGQVGNVPIEQLLSNISNFKDILTNSPYSVRVNPNLKSIVINGVTFNEVNVP